MSVADAKPEPIRVGVEGFNAVAARVDPVQAVDWERLLNLPPVQMFIADRNPQIERLRTIDGVRDYLLSIQGKQEADQLYADYCGWHEAKGYWPNETPLGELKH